MAGSDKFSDIADAGRSGLSTWRFFWKLLSYFGAHNWQVTLILVSCSFETSFYWIVPLTFRYLIDNSLGGSA